MHSRKKFNNDNYFLLLFPFSQSDLLICWLLGHLYSSRNKLRDKTIIYSDMHAQSICYLWHLQVDQASKQVTQFQLNGVISNGGVSNGTSQSAR